MSFSVVIRCGRDWVPGDPCRQATPLGVVESFDEARTLAARFDGWSTVVDDSGRTIDRCPACTRRELAAPRASHDRVGRPLPPVPPDYFGQDGRGRRLPPVATCTLPCCLGRPWHRAVERHA